MFRLFPWLKPTAAPPLSHIRFCIKHQFSPSIWPSFCIKTLNSVNGPSSCLTRVSPYSSYPNLPNSQQKMEVFLAPTHLPPPPPRHSSFPFCSPLQGKISKQFSLVHLQFSQSSSIKFFYFCSRAWSDSPGYFCLYFFCLESFPFYRTAFIPSKA